MSTPKLHIAFRSKAERTLDRVMRTALERQIGEKKALGEDYSELEELFHVAQGLGSPKRWAWAIATCLSEIPTNIVVLAARDLEPAAHVKSLVDGWETLHRAELDLIEIQAKQAEAFRALRRTQIQMAAKRNEISPQEAARMQGELESEAANTDIARAALCDEARDRFLQRRRELDLLLIQALKRSLASGQPSIH